MKMRVASRGNQTHDTLYSKQMLYQLSYQGSSAGRVRMKHLIHLYEQANFTCNYMDEFTYSAHIVLLIVQLHH